MGLSREQMGLDDAHRMPASPVLVAKRKKPSGYGFMTTTPEDRFFVVNPRQGTDKIRALHPSYQRFNECPHAAIVSRLPCRLAGQTLPQVAEYNRGLYRWDPKTMGPPPKGYSAPRNQNAWCSTKYVEQTGEEAKAMRWNGKEFKPFSCLGEDCEFSCDKSWGPGGKSPCIKQTDIWFMPEWQALADMVNVDKSESVRAFGDAVSRLPDSLLKLHTGGKYAPSTQSWDTMIRFVQREVESFLSDMPETGRQLYGGRVSLLGLPFWITVGKKTGQRQYTVYDFELRGSIHEWLAQQAEWRRSIVENRQHLLVAENPGDHEVDVVAADMIEAADLVIPSRASRPASVATVVEPTPADLLRSEWVRETGRDVDSLEAWCQMKLGKALDALDDEGAQAARDEMTRIKALPAPVLMTPGKVRALRASWVKITGLSVEVLESRCQDGYGCGLEGMLATSESEVMLWITGTAKESRPSGSS